MNEFYELDKSPQYDVDAIRRRKRQKLRKKRKRKIKIFVFLFLITGIIVGTGLSPLFNIVSINVEDTPHYTGDEIKAYALSLVGLNGFQTVFENYVDGSRAVRLRLAALEDKLASTFIYADSVKVRFNPPAKINIEVKERSPFAVVRTSDKMILVDQTGYVLEEIAENTDNYIQINGIENVKTSPGSYFCDNSKEVMETADNVISVLSDLDNSDENKLVSQINSINLGDIRRVKLFIDSRIVVVLGDVRNGDTLRYRGNYLRQLFFKFINKNDKGTIDFTLGEDPRFIPNKMQ